jgi:hypothetical protein
MTLDTRVYALDRVDPHETFRFCRGLLGATERHVWYDRQDQSYVNGEWTVRPDNAWTVANQLDQGLPAILDISYRPDVPLRTSEQAAEHDEDICNLPGCDWYDPAEGPCDGKYHSRACWLEVSFDTSYGYRDQRGYGCGDLHAELVSKLGQWLDERKVRWEWRNEFTGEIHTGYKDLVRLASGGFEASAWFRTSVLPIIAAERGESR